MKRTLPYLGVTGAALLCVTGVAMAAIGATSLGSASGARHSAKALYEARLQVAEAQEQVGGSDLEDAVQGAREANASALAVKTITARIAALLHATRDDAEVIGRSSQRGVSTVVATRQQTEAAARALAAISAYQRSATKSAITTNRALRRILHALRETNESFPGR